MALTALFPRTSTSGSRPRRSSIADNLPSPSDSTPSPTHHLRHASLKRLSLGLSRTDYESFHSFMTQEPEQISPRDRTTQPKFLEQPPASHSELRTSTTPAAASRARSEHPDQPTPPAAPPGAASASSSRRLSLLGGRHASDPQLSTRFKQDDNASAPAVSAAPPKIITTAPTREFESLALRPKPSLLTRAQSPFRRSQLFRQSPVEEPHRLDGRSARPVDAAASTPALGLQEKSSFEHLPRKGLSHPPPAYGDDSSSSLAIPVKRLSDSSRSDDSSGDHHVYAKTTTTHTISTTTTFFKLKRRSKKKKDKGPLFPLPERFPRPSQERARMLQAGLEGANGRKSMSPSRRSNTAVRFNAEPPRRRSGEPSPTRSATALTNAPFGSPGPTIVRQDSTWSTHSGHSTPSVSLVPPRMTTRGRSSTLSSLGRSAERLPDHGHQQTASARTSTSTTGGRKSFGDLLALPHRLRQNSTPPLKPGAANTPSSQGSKANSLQIAREAEPERVYPRREDGDTPTTYLEKLEAAVPRGAMATILCKSADDFSKTCLRKYMRGFSYFGDSVDMAIRKMLMEVELPKETQQIDRLLAGFADRYYECNPGIFSSIDEAAFVAFSILLLHSDTHNKNNKHKMQKQDYVKNTQQGPVQVSNDILDVFFDNICYTPFIHFEDEVAINSHRLAAPRMKKSLIKTKSFENLRGPVDPYTLILDNKLDVLRPALKDVINTEDSYSSTGTAGSVDPSEHHKAFTHSAVLQIVSARSRPDAFLNQATITNPIEAQAGLVSIKVAKVGLLWRKDPKKKKAKRPWQEWGAILTDSKLYFFKDVGWVKKLISQYEAHSRATGKVGTLIFKPPLSSFEPDALMSMDDAVALLDSSYKKHKNAILFIKHGGFEEVFLANSELEMNDWIGKLNYAATFRTAGVRMRGLLVNNYEGRHLLRKDSEVSTVSTSTESPHKDKKMDPQMAWEIMFYRRQLINEKISDYEEKVAVAQKELDHLLRNARHLLVLTPIQQKTRESLVYAAGRMSAKLKWTRVELWRNKTHRDILAKDLEQEGSHAFPAPRAAGSSSGPQQATPIKTTASDVGRTISDTSHLTLSPISPTSSRLSNMVEKLRTPDSHSKRGDSSNLDLPADASPATLGEPSLHGEPRTDGRPLTHQASIISSHHSVDKENLVRPADDVEEQVLREAGLIGIDGNVPKDKRPDTSGSERDRFSTITPTPDVSKHSSVRRSLQRSLREGPHLHHHSPNNHRHKKARESGSSIAPTEDGGRSVNSEGDELKRGASSFILHGKKASVVTMSSEWQAMSNEDRMKLRGIHDSDLKKPAPVVDDEDAIETASNLTKETDESETFESPRSSRKPSVATTSADHFVDAKMTVDSTESEAGSPILQKTGDDDDNDKCKENDKKK